MGSAAAAAAAAVGAATEGDRRAGMDGRRVIRRPYSEVAATVTRKREHFPGSDGINRDSEVVVTVIRRPLLRLEGGCGHDDAKER